MDKLLGFLPDADPTLPGVITLCDNLIPYEYGMKGAPTGLTPSGVPVLAATCQGAVISERLDGTRRTLAGTQTKLYELLAGVWTDVSAGSYTGGVDSRWSFAQFGNASLASNGADTIQRSDTSGSFAAIATAPKAKIIFSVGAFVMALSTTDATYGVSGDRWWCCASFDDTSWTPSVSTLATTGRLVSSPGEIVAGGRLGEYAVAYKAKSIYLGQYVGAPAVWDWLPVPGGEAGCVGPEAWCDIGGAHFVVGMDNLWLFDGSRPVPLGGGEVRQWFYNYSNPKQRYKIKCVFDRQNNTVWIHYPSLFATECDRALVYHVQTKQWGLATLNVEAVLNYISPGVTIDGLTTYGATIDALSGYSFDSQFWILEGRVLAAINSSHQLQALNGPTASSWLTTGDAGDDERYSLLRKIRLRFAPAYAPASASVLSYSKAVEGDALTLRASGNLADGKFDLLQSGRWHRATFNFTGDVRLLALGAVLVPQGVA